MGILDEISSATGDKSSNQELVIQCLKTPALLHTIAEGLRTGTPKAKIDCAEILTAVAARHPDLLSDFVTDFLDASKSSARAIAKLGFQGLVHLTTARPAEVYAERDYLLEAAKGPHGLEAVAVLACLCGNNPNYRGKLLGSLVRLLAGVPDKDLARWVATLAPAVQGSADGLKRLTLALEPRRPGLPEAARKKIDKLLVKLEKSTLKK
jgi:hypothetical protein